MPYNIYPHPQTNNQQTTMIEKFIFKLKNNKIYKTDEIVDSVLRESLHTGIVETEQVNYYIYITFTNGVCVKAWNVNKYHGWIARGTIFYPNNKEYTWHDAMPTKDTLYCMLKALKEYELSKMKNIISNNHNINAENITLQLPIKIRESHEAEYIITDANNVQYIFCYSQSKYEQLQYLGCEIPPKTD